VVVVRELHPLSAVLVVLAAAVLVCQEALAHREHLILAVVAVQALLAVQAVQELCFCDTLQA
jgi:hypothetical protein